MRTIPYDNMNCFWLKISKNPKLLMYLHHNPLYFNLKTKVKSGLDLSSVKYLLSHIINDEKLIFFLWSLENDLKPLEDDYIEHRIMELNILRSFEKSNLKQKKIDCPQKTAWVKKSNFKPSKIKNTR
jgi:hypothetical protein